MEFIDYVEAGLELKQARDENAWQLGDLASDFEVKLGRPDDPEAPTLSDLASAWDEQKPRVSEWRSVARFYPDNVRIRELSWRHHNLARRYSDGELDNALELLATAQAQHMNGAAFERYLKGIWYEGTIQRDELPARLQALMPSREGTGWLRLKRFEDD